MTTESIVAIASAIINGAVCIGVFKLFNEYKSYNKETSWKNVKEHYEEIRIPHELAKAEKAIIEDVERQIEELSPLVDELNLHLSEFARFTANVLLLHLNKDTGQKLVNEKMPNCAQYFVKIWAFHDQHKDDIQEIRQSQ